MSTETPAGPDAATDGGEAADAAAQMAAATQSLRSRLTQIADSPQTSDPYPM